MWTYAFVVKGLFFWGGEGGVTHAFTEGASRLPCSRAWGVRSSAGESQCQAAGSDAAPDPAAARLIKANASLKATRNSKQGPLRRPAV